MRSTLGRILWHLGFPDQALARCHEAVALARQASDPFALALALIYDAELHGRRREIHLALEYAEAVISLSREQGFTLYVGWGTVLRGWALAGQGSHSEGIAQMREGLNAHKAAGAILERPTLLGLLADAYGKAEQPEEGLRVLGEALALAHETGERFDEPMLLRLKGELILLLSAEEDGSSSLAEEAEVCLQQAIAIAHHQVARSAELEASISLARLWQCWGRTNDARVMLAGIHGMFIEGSDTADWQEAKKLLERLR